MTEDATLSEFGIDSSDEDDSLCAEDDGSCAGGDGENSRDVESDGDDTSDSRPETSRSTYAWGTYTCGNCQDETDRVWREDGGFVCSACKEW
ncbi:DUF7573 domain-containing protein [Natrarchaeobius chitinivorans]|uniref:DUF7573 domain-containing protein n=1 Tax=Natrarchaeobius chitinivorans TaxID=1679083 RepID=A0A3N6MQ37_NATCH|nr:hypothetical protein [Natrarchaeobius chitinivorans]RQG96686.1 hypothetical protein EA473_05115 [Natrarchaeobius chitinivorans]